jgi:hypothetical protein
MTAFTLQYEDREPDNQGRRHFVMFWEEPHGVFRPEPSKRDGQPVGHRRAQQFFTDPQAHIRSLEYLGHKVEVVT